MQCFLHQVKSMVHLSALLYSLLGIKEFFVRLYIIHTYYTVLDLIEAEFYTTTKGMSYTN